MRYNISKFRKRAKMTQTELAEKANVSRATISGLESGRVKSVSMATLEKIADALNKPVTKIFLP